MKESDFVTVLKQTGLPVRYSHFANPQEPPFLVYIGSGQTVLNAENVNYWHDNEYIVQYYYTQKDPDQEEAIEDVLTAAELAFTKSEDMWLESEGVYAIYYYV